MTANTFLIDAATRHAVFLQRFAGGRSNEAQELLSRLAAEVNRRLLLEPTEFQHARLSILMADIEQTLALFMRELSESTVQMALDLAASEAQFSAAMVGEVSRVPLVIPSDAKLSAVVLGKGMDAPLGPSQITIQEALDQFAGSKSAEVLNTINDSILTGETNVDAARKVSSLVEDRQKRHVDALVRTISNSTSAQARAVTLEENAGLLEGYEWVSTLDSRTTLICGGRDGRIYPTGKGPLPAAHWNCRSTVIPVVREEFAVKGVTGERPADGVDKDGTKRRGPVSAKETYGGWLKKQSADFQDEALGPDRAFLFRNGGLRIDQYRDETGRTYSLEELKQLQPLAFQKAGVTVQGNRIVKQESSIF